MPLQARVDQYLEQEILVEAKRHHELSQQIYEQASISDNDIHCLLREEGVPHCVHRSPFKEEPFGAKFDLVFDQKRTNDRSYGVFCQASSVHLPVNLRHTAMPATPNEADPSTVSAPGSGTECAFERVDDFEAPFENRFGD